MQKQQDMQKRRAEEAVRAHAKEQEEKKRRIEELKANMVKEQQAVAAITKAISKIRVATPETFEEDYKDLEDTLKAQLDKAGSQRVRMKVESDRAVELAKGCIEKVLEARRIQEEMKQEEERKRREAEEEEERKKAEEERKKAEEERKKKEAEDHLNALVEELNGLIISAERHADALKQSAGPLEQQGRLSDEVLEGTVRAVDEAMAKAEEMAKKCTAFVLGKGQDMRKVVASTGGSHGAEVSKTLSRLLQEIDTLRRAPNAVIPKMEAARVELQKRANAHSYFRDMQTIFEKYDGDGDGRLSRREVRRWAQAEYGFAVPSETLTEIWEYYVEEGQRGVELKKFQKLRVMIGIAREVDRDRRIREAREEVENLFENLKPKLREKLSELADVVGNADSYITKAEKSVQPLTAQAGKLPFNEAIPMCDEVDASVVAAKSTLVTARQKLETLGEDCDGRIREGVQAYVLAESKQLDLRMGRMVGRLVRATNLSKRARDRAHQKWAEETEPLRTAGKKIIRRYQKIKKLSDEELFEQFDSAAQGAIDRPAFLSFFSMAGEAVDKHARDRAMKGPKVDKKAVSNMMKHFLMVQGQSAAGASAAGGGADPGGASDEEEVLEPVEPMALTEVAQLFACLDQGCAGSISKEAFMTLLLDLPCEIEVIRESTYIGD